jgi:hypothetical protein
MKKIKNWFFLFLCLGCSALADTQTRINQSIAAHQPIVVHVSVALADNEHQWIAPVPSFLGNGQDPKSNLYWGARYGIKTYLVKDGGWKKLAHFKPQNKKILERLVFRHDFTRNGTSIPVYLIADAWDGEFIKDAINQFLRYNAGYDPVTLTVPNKTIEGGGNAHLITYIGHNALMDFNGLTDSVTATPISQNPNPDNDAIILACKSKPYFTARLNKIGATPLVLTTGLMAPEAYSLHAAIEQWIAGANTNKVRQAAADSYAKYQKANHKFSRQLFDAQ